MPMSPPTATMQSPSTSASASASAYSRAGSTPVIASSVPTTLRPALQLPGSMLSTSRNAPLLPASDKAVQVLGGAALLARLEVAQKAVGQGTKATKNRALRSPESLNVKQEAGEASDASYPIAA